MASPDPSPLWSSTLERDFTAPVTDHQFDSAITVWIKKPHTVNRRLIGAKIIHETEISGSGNCFATIWDNIKGLRADQTIEELFEKLGDILTPSDETPKRTLCLSIRDLVPRLLERYHTTRELIVKCDKSVAFFPLYHIDASGQYQHEDETLSYSIHKQSDRLQFRLSPSPCEPPCPALGVSESWLGTSLLPRLVSWCHAPSLNTEQSSLRLLPVDEYTARYQRLKAKYGPRLVESWQENTDPRKFVYEDIAIATYLLLLWEQERKEKSRSKKQTFVDLGCGNGLLVHLLASEGHEGIGIDIRKRKIWDQYGEETVLKEMSITPSNHSLFPEYDWLIGNHSDELTPWIPVMAARSSYRCKFFVLPCCQWDFTGKFSHRKTGTSQYRAYLDYVLCIGKMCGFEVQEDALRIPSTKRICFIGQKRTYRESGEQEREAIRSLFIENRTYDLKRKREDSTGVDGDSTAANHDTAESTAATHDTAESTAESHGTAENTAANHGTAENTHDTAESTEEGASKWAENFQARRPEEAVSKNCLNIDSDIKERIMMTVFRALLDEPNRRMLTLEGRGDYNIGGTLALGDVIELFDGDTLKRLKSECGGMQTLLRNNHQLFHVEKGCVKLRDWTDETQHALHQSAKKKRKGLKPKKSGEVQTKTRLCFLHTNHPHGCPLPADTCRFAHGEEELRTKTPPTT